MSFLHIEFLTKKAKNARETEYIYTGMPKIELSHEPHSKNSSKGTFVFLRCDIFSIQMTS